jgi:uncharacterized damage-inducible protein DinB
MRIDDIRLLYAYNAWANDRIMTTAAALTPEQLHAPAVPDPGYGTIFGSLVHLLEAEHAWRVVLETGDWPEMLTPDDFPTLDALATFWRTEAAAMQAYLARLTDADMDGITRYAVEEGGYRERVRWHCLVHVVNHGTYHRGEVAALLTGQGHSPGELDFTLFLRSMEV